MAKSPNAKAGAKSNVSAATDRLAELAQNPLARSMLAAGLVAAPKMTDYAASKHAAVGFDDALRVELRRLGYRNIRTTIVCPYYINTGMFKGARTRFRRLLPIMEPEDATNKIIEAIERNKRRLVMPPFAMINYPGRLLPLSLFDRVAEFVGISKSMDDFTGHGE